MSLASVLLAENVRVQFIEGIERALTTRTLDGIIPKRSGVLWDIEPYSEVEVLSQKMCLHILEPSKRTMIAIQGVVLSLPQWCGRYRAPPSLIVFCDRFPITVTAGSKQYWITRIVCVSDYTILVQDPV